MTVGDSYTSVLPGVDFPGLHRRSLCYHCQMPRLRSLLYGHAQPDPICVSSQRAKLSFGSSIFGARSNTRVVPGVCSTRWGTRFVLRPQPPCPNLHDHWHLDPIPEMHQDIHSGPLCLALWNTIRPQAATPVTKPSRELSQINNCVIPCGILRAVDRLGHCWPSLTGI